MKSKLDSRLCPRNQLGWWTVPLGTGLRAGKLAAQLPLQASAEIHVLQQFSENTAKGSASFDLAMANSAQRPGLPLWSDKLNLYPENVESTPEDLQAGSQYHSCTEDHQASGSRKSTILLLPSLHEACHARDMSRAGRKGLQAVVFTRSESSLTSKLYSLLHSTRSSS